MYRPLPLNGIVSLSSVFSMELAKVNPHKWQITCTCTRTHIVYHNNYNYGQKIFYESVKKQTNSILGQRQVWECPYISVLIFKL